ncbi:MAG: hypothetical protein WC910_07350 [Bacteroidales bacterium]|jgi:hypothetical protein
MSTNPYSNRQIEVANLLNSVSKDGEGVPAEVIDEILGMVSDAEIRSVNAAAAENKETTETMLRIKILEEKDWKKRASLAALLISKSFD